MADEVVSPMSTSLLFCAALCTHAYCQYNHCVLKGLLAYVSPALLTTGNPLPSGSLVHRLSSLSYRSKACCSVEACAPVGGW